MHRTQAFSVNSNPTKTYKIFVAGLPANTDPLQILDFFRGFGQIRLLKPRSVKEAEMKKKKGHCILICLDKGTLNSIVSIGSFKFKGRNVSAQPFKSGAELIIQNQEMTAARVIIKKVPKSVSEFHLRAILERDFGKLKSLYRFILDETKLKADAKKVTFYQQFDSYSAIFESREAAMSLAARHTLLLDGKFAINVEHYKPRRVRSEHESYLSDPIKGRKVSYSTHQDIEAGYKTLGYATLPLTKPTEEKLANLPQGDDWTALLRKPTNREYFLDAELPMRPHFFAKTPTLESLSNYCFRFSS